MVRFRVHLCGECWTEWCKGRKYKDYPPWLKYLISQSWRTRTAHDIPALGSGQLERNYARYFHDPTRDPSIR